MKARCGTRARASRPPSVNEQIREDIIVGGLPANERLHISALAARHNTSTNPVREAPQQLRGEGFVLFTQNRGARVRPVDEDFRRDIYEIEALIEPHLTRWFVGIVTDADIKQMEDIQAEIETLNFADPGAHSVFDTGFTASFTIATTIARLSTPGSRTARSCGRSPAASTFRGRAAWPSCASTANSSSASRPAMSRARRVS